MSINLPLPKQPIGENFQWREWFNRLNDVVFGSLATQNHGSVDITGGTLNNVNIINSTIPATEISGLGTMAKQNANSVTITGGTVPLSTITGAGTMASQNSNTVAITGGTVTATVGLTNTTAATATTGSSGALPATCAGYVIINIGGTNYKLPYFNV